MRTLNLALIFCLLIVGYNCAIVAWNGTSNGDWNTPTNWNTGQVPGSNDDVTLGAGFTISVSQGTTVNSITTTANSKLSIINNSTLTVTNNITQATTFTLQTEAGSTFTTSTNYFIFGGAQVTFINFGTTNINPMVIGAVTSGVMTNTAVGNNVNFPGTKPNLINGAFFIPSGFQFAQVAQTFTSTVGAAITFGYTETIASAGWTFDTLLLVNVVFQQGVNINGGLTLVNGGLTRPTFTFAGTVNIANSLTYPVVPVIGQGGVVTFNGQTLTFDNIGVTINAQNIIGTGTVNFNNNQGPAPLVAVISRTVSIDIPNFGFGNNWVFSGSTVIFSQARNFNFNLTLTNNNLVFLKPTTFAANSLFLVTGVSTLKFTDGIISNNAITFNGIVPQFDCTTPNKAFSINGTSSLTFPVGLTINGCAVSSSAQLSITGAVNVMGNSSLPSTPTTTFTNNDVTFSNTGTVTSLVLNGAYTIPNGRIYTASGVEVIYASALSVNDNSRLANAANGLFTLAGGVTFGTNTQVTGTVAFNSGSVSIAASNLVTWSGEVILRNTVLGGTGEVYFTGQLTATKGESNITNPNFRFKGGVNLQYLWDGLFPNIGCQLVINTNGATGTRFIEGNVNAQSSSNIVFDDNINFNTSASISGNGATLGSVTFRTSSQSPFITTNGVISFQRNIYFNNSNYHLQGIGRYQFVANGGNNPNVFVQGSINNPTSGTDAIVNSVDPLTVGVVSNSTFGNTFTIGSSLTTDDLDNNPLVASTKLTLASTTSQSRIIQGAYILNSSLTFGGNVVVNSATTINSIGEIEIQGNSIVLGASPTWRNKVTITGATTITTSQTGGATLTLGEQTPNHGFNIPSTLTVTNPAALVFNGLYVVNFQTSTGSLGGNGQLTITDTFLSGSGAVTISPLTLTTTNVTLVGTGSFLLGTGSQNLTVNNFLRAFVPTTFNGSNLIVQSATTISPLVSFSASPLSITGSTLTVSAGSYSISNRWDNNNAGLVFLGTVTLAAGGNFSGTSNIKFNQTLILTSNLTLGQSITFGENTNYIVTVSNGGFGLTLTGPSITVGSIVVSNGGSIISTSSPNNIQSISGGGVINSDWTWTNTVQFGNLNITGARTISFNLVLTNNQRTFFRDAITFNGGSFLPSVSGDTPIIGFEKSITTNVNTLLVPAVTVLVSGTTFTFGGPNTLTLNGTFNSSSTITFNTSVIFGYSTPTTGNVIYLKTGTTAWIGSVTLQIWRTSVVVETGVTAEIFPTLIFGLNTISLSNMGTGKLTLSGNLNVAGTSLSTGSSVYLNVITITSLQNNTLSGLNLLGTLTLNSTTTPWVEPLVSVTGGILTQSIFLNGPARMNNPTFGTGAQFSGPARLAITNGININTNTAFRFGVLVQLYVDTPTGTFTITLNGAASFLTFTVTPSLFNPLGYNLVTATNFAFNAPTANNVNICKFTISTPLVFGDVTVSGGTLQLNGGVTNASNVLVQSGATLWVDYTALTSSSLSFSANDDGTSPSYFQYTISTNPGPTSVSTGAVIYKGVASVVVPNSAWDGSNVVAITANTATNGATANFQSVVGTPGYTYRSTRQGNNVAFSRTLIPTSSPFPTQSNGPSPAVSSSNIVSASFLLFAIIVIFFIFN